MNMVLLIAQIIISVILIGSILLQSQGSGMSPIWGGGEHYHTRRGIEKILFGVTIVGIVFFVVLSIINVVIAQ